jgi:hypothetical protein
MRVQKMFEQLYSACGSGADRRNRSLAAVKFTEVSRGRAVFEVQLAAAKVQ